jgi:ketosteroid isomerase-like protein
MSLNRVLMFTLGCAVACGPTFTFAGNSGKAAATARTQSAGAPSAADQEVLKRDADCNAAELRADLATMDDCETGDFTHVHANGMVEHKAEYLQGVGSGAHKFLTLDQSDLHVNTYGDAAIVQGHIHLRANNSGKIADVHNFLMTVWVKQQGKWREASWMAVGLPEKSAADGK